MNLMPTGAAPVSQAIQEQLISIFPNAHLGQAYGKTFNQQIFYI